MKLLITQVLATSFNTSPLLDPVLPSYVFAFAIAVWLVEEYNTHVLAGVVYFGGNKLIHILLKL
jgi:hypothetical protein